MKMGILTLLFLPALAFAQNSPKCTFSKKSKVDYQLDVKGCTQKLCTHLVVCGSVAKTVTCPSANGGCDGYSADDCIAKSEMIEADFD